MLLEDLVLVSVDDHVVEPPDMFEGRLAARYADDAPRVLEREDGTEVWRFCAMDATNIGLNAVVGRPVEEYGIEPTSFAEIRRGCYDIHERIRDMDANGVIGSMCFPSFPNLCGQLFAKATDDRDLGLAVLRAYNDWHIRGVVRHVSRALHPARSRSDLGPRRDGGRGKAARPDGLPRGLVLGEPRQAQASELPLRPLGPFLVRVRRRGDDRLPSHRLFFFARHDGGRCAHRRAARATAGEHHPGRGRPPLVAGASQVPGP